MSGCKFQSLGFFVAIIEQLYLLWVDHLAQVQQIIRIKFLKALHAKIKYFSLTTRFNEIWLADTTILKTLDGKKTIFIFLMDHYSKMILRQLE